VVSTPSTLSAKRTSPRFESPAGSRLEWLHIVESFKGVFKQNINCAGFC
jgi:hypothetical protein